MAALIERRDQLGERERLRALAQLAQQREEPFGILAPVRGECIVKIAAPAFSRAARRDRSGVKPKSGERSTEMSGTSCRGLSNISSSAKVTATSIVS